jgi:hypothetical protein
VSGQRRARRTTSPGPTSGPENDGIKTEILTWHPAHLHIVEVALGAAVQVLAAFEVVLEAADLGGELAGQYGVVQVGRVAPARGAGRAGTVGRARQLKMT